MNEPYVDEHVVRAAAGLTMAGGAVAFALANYDHRFVPIRIVTTFFAIDFALRVTLGLRRSPVGFVAQRLTVAEPLWVSARPKRFAWGLGLVMSVSMAVITNAGIHGALPRTICLTCLTLMWLEAVLGLCLGCELYGFLVRRKVIGRLDGFDVCVGGACGVAGRPTIAGGTTETMPSSERAGRPRP